MAQPLSAVTDFSIESILVRTYENRTDLLRSLIIGPENTPYEDAPFVIDWMLDSNFPDSPPKAHFLSWTNGWLILFDLKHMLIGFIFELQATEEVS
jgi:ubiquitin-protein ligase